jgi:hypothetical protein
MADEELPKCSTELELISTSLEHSWNWFKSHADQRLTITRFAILVLGATGAGVGYLEKDQEYFFCALLSIFGAVAAYCFLRLDVRTSDLIKVGEFSLSDLQHFLAEATRFSSLEMNKKSEELSVESKKKKLTYPYSYKQVFSLLFSAISIIYLISAGYSFLKLWKWI